MPLPLHDKRRKLGWPCSGRAVIRAALINAGMAKFDHAWTVQALRSEGNPIMPLCASAVIENGGPDGLSLQFLVLRLKIFARNSWPDVSGGGSTLSPKQL